MKFIPNVKIMAALVAPIVILTSVTAINSSTTRAEAFSYEFNLYTTGADAPFYTENAFFRKENFLRHR